MPESNPGLEHSLLSPEEYAKIEASIEAYNPIRIQKQRVDFLSVTPDALKLIELAGRTCYKSEDRITEQSAEKFVRMIMKRGHESVLEHASATFRIITDRGITHEIVRHRLASYSQESTRYCNYGNRGITFVPPPDLNLAQQHEWMEFCKESEAAYNALLKLGCNPGIARSVLPNCLKTEIVMTANFREWRYFLKLRLSKAAHPQIREVAGMILDWFVENYPVIVADAPDWRN